MSNTEFLFGATTEEMMADSRNCEKKIFAYCNNNPEKIEKVVDSVLSIDYWSDGAEYRRAMAKERYWRKRLNATSNEIFAFYWY